MCNGLDIILLIGRLCLGEFQEPPPPVNNYGQECPIIQPSRQDTDGTLAQIAKANARCRAARANIPVR